MALAYKGLWQVEETFRTLKTPLELRPIYHWSESRVRGHVMVCFLAFILRQHLRLKLKEVGWEGTSRLGARRVTGASFHTPTWEVTR